MALWLFSGLYSNREQFKAGAYLGFGGNLLLFALLCLLGWHVFGNPIQG